MEVQWPASRGAGTGYLTVGHGGVLHKPVSITTYAKVHIEFGALMNHPPFSQQESRLDLFNRLNSIPGVRINEDRITTYPSIPMKTFDNPEAMRQFLAVLDWVVNEIRNPSV